MRKQAEQLANFVTARVETRMQFRDGTSCLQVKGGLSATACVRDGRAVAYRGRPDDGVQALRFGVQWTPLAESVDDADDDDGAAFFLFVLRARRKM